MVVCCHSDILYSTASLHRESQGPKQAASSGNASEGILRKLHTLLQEEAARPGEIKQSLSSFVSLSPRILRLYTRRTQVVLAASARRCSHILDICNTESEY